MIVRLIVLALSISCASAFQFSIPPSMQANNAANGSGQAAPGSFISLFHSYGLPADLAGVDIRLTTSGGNTFSLPPVEPPRKTPYAWAVIPLDAPLGLATVSLSVDGIFRGSDSIEIVAAAPSLFTQNYAGNGPAIALNTANFRIGLTTAAVPGSEVALFATGLGGAATENVSVEIGGQPAPVVYAGPQGLPGLDQINLIIPKDSLLGCYVPVIVRIGGVQSNMATLAINPDPNTCTHPLGLTYSDLKKLDAGGMIPVARLLIAGNHEPAAEAYFLDADTDAVFRASGPQMPGTQYFSCSIPPSWPEWSTNKKPPSTPITLSGPDGRQIQFLSPYYMVYAPTNPTPFFDAGTWQWSAPDGPQFAAFRKEFSLPPMILSINLAPGTKLAGARDLTLTWDPSGFSPSDTVTVQFEGFDPFYPEPECHAHAQAGQITLPSSMLTHLRGRSLYVAIRVRPHPTARPQFPIYLQDGSMIPAVADYNFALSVPVTVE